MAIGRMRLILGWQLDAWSHWKNEMLTRQVIVGYFSTLVLLTIGSLLFALVSFHFAGLSGNGPDGTSNYDRQLLSVPISALYGVPLILSTLNRPNLRARCITFFVVLPIVCGATAAIHAILLIFNYSESDTSGSLQQWVPVFTAGLGAATTMIVFGSVGWAPRISNLVLVTIVSSIAVSAFIASHVSYDKLVVRAIEIISGVPTDLGKEWPAYGSKICFLWQIFFAPFLAWVLKAGDGRIESKF